MMKESSSCISPIPGYQLPLDEEAQDDLRANKNPGVYKGAVFENIIAEAFYKSHLPLYYYKKEDSTLEIAFFLRTKNDLIPVEAKATTGNAKSLKTLLNNPAYPDIKRGIKLGKYNIGWENNILTLPYFCVFLLKRLLADI